MNNQTFFILVIVCIAAHIIRSVYEILKHKNILKSSRLTFIIIFINMVMLQASWFGLCSMDIFKIMIPDVIRYLGLLFVLSGVISFLTALFAIKTLEDYSGDLITNGIYTKIRHPMYLGFICWCIGDTNLLRRDNFNLFISSIYRKHFILEIFGRKRIR